MLLSDAVKRYVAYLTECQWSEPHIRTVEYRLGRFVNGRADQDIKTISRTVLSEYFIQLRVGKADGTMAGYTSTHRAFWKFAKKRGWIKTNPAKKLRSWSCEPQMRKAAPEVDVQAVVDCLSDFVNRHDQRPRDVRDALLVSLSIDCGGRLGAMCNLKRSEVLKALERGRVAKNGRMAYVAMVNQGKTGAAHLEFGEETAELFRLWFRVMPKWDTDRVFINLMTGEPLLRNTVGRSFVPLCKFAGVPPFRSHAVRKRNVSSIAQETKDVEIAQRYAGHRDLETTVRFYKEKREDDVLEAAAELAARRRGRPDVDDELAKLFGVKRPKGGA